MVGKQLLNYMRKPMSKARREKNQPKWINKASYIMTDNATMWEIIERGIDITEVVPFYRDGGEDKLYVNTQVNEMTHFCGVPFDNYAITSFGRVWSFKTKKFIKAFYRPNSVIVYMNSTSNVKVKDLFHLAGWGYKHGQVVDKLLSLNLLVNDYKTT